LTILAVTGMTKEAEIAGGNGVVAVVGGGDAAGLAAKLDALHGDITGVISIGLAGALSPHLKVGDVVIADRILEAPLPRARDSAPNAGEMAVAGPWASEGQRGQKMWLCNSQWRVALAAKLPFAHQGPMVGSAVILENAQSKAALYQVSGALAVDMESQVAARFAASRGLKLAALRVISDDATHVLPPAALVAMQPDGGIALGRVLWSVAKNPLQIPALIRTGRASSKAFAQLLCCRDLCGVGLCGVGSAGLDL
jgi:adenosylhomocysteine nucleosidase